MKKQNKTNNVGNTIRSILLDDGHFLFKLKKKSTSSTWRYFDTINTRGITLIALIITIILMLILAGIVLNLTIGKNGLFNTAKYAVKKWNNSVEQENAELDELYAYINGESLPENTKDTDAGTLVAVPDSWKTSTPTYIRTSDGKEVVSSKKISTVQAVATGDGETVPVPLGFYYVGGKISIGVVISDNSADKNKYVNYTNTEEVPEGIPTGVEYNEDGTINTENSDLKGNQFVWIPVSANEYVKKEWGKENASWEKQTNTAELIQIQKYGGFYIGRYEAGTSNISLSTGVNFANKNTASSWVNDNFSIRDGLNHTATGKIVTKAGEIPYYHADYETALKLSNTMYQTEYVQSGLVTGTMWDAMMKFIAGNDNAIVTSSNWGNYTDGNVKYTNGQGRYATVDSNNGTMTSAFTKCNGTYYYGIKTTAISESVKKKNLYDVAGGLWEWTQEASYPDNTNESYMLRGGSFRTSYVDNPACCRGYDTAPHTVTHFGFRPALYMK